ncbi:unnamed protein product [Phytophthora fragariaefolia]|uniref:Unnamed protein product n=1 Tax=Phytophthora fragariaefolia TaxID=1490495 RepID=A0A9W6U5I8_9STRA|nr:unnamed protein product [Phytophthora fragariaefolia]
MADRSWVRCDNEVVLNLELVTIAGPVLMRSVACVILAGEGDEFLLGSDALKMLGIDIQDQLAQLAGSPLLDAEDDKFPVGGELPNDEEPPEYDAAFGHLLERAVANDLPREHVGAVRELLAQFPDAWREAIGQDPPANGEPLRVTLRQDAVPFRSPPRKDAPLQTQFIREYVKSLVDTGLVEQNNASRWACAVAPVRKPGTQDQFRLTIDYRPVNRVTVPIAGTMPTVATVVDSFNGKKIFGRFDFTQGFWRLPFHKDSQEVFSFVTPDGVFTPTRVPQGAMDSALHFQSQVQSKLAPLIPHSALVRIIRTQVRVWDASLPVEDQAHELIVCKGGVFKHNELNWTVVEKEAFPIIKACHDLDYFLLRPKGFLLSVTMPTWRTSLRPV